MTKRHDRINRYQSFKVELERTLRASPDALMACSAMLECIADYVHDMGEDDPGDEEGYTSAELAHVLESINNARATLNAKGWWRQ